MKDQTQLPFFSAGLDLPLFNETELTPEELATEATIYPGDVCECNHPPHLETRQCQYDKALAALDRRKQAGTMTNNGYSLELAHLNADYPECSRDPDSPALCESCLELPATGELCGSPLCDDCAERELATMRKLGLPVF